MILLTYKLVLIDGRHIGIVKRIMRCSKLSLGRRKEKKKKMRKKCFLFSLEGSLEMVLLFSIYAVEIRKKETLRSSKNERLNFWRMDWNLFFNPKGFWANPNFLHLKQVLLCNLELGTERKPEQFISVSYGKAFMACIWNFERCLILTWCIAKGDGVKRVGRCPKVGERFFVNLSERRVKDYGGGYWKILLYFSFILNTKKFRLRMYMNHYEIHVWNVNESFLVVSLFFFQGLVQTLLRYVWILNI